jgi:predicted XRE-type DNA-binding protein
LLIYVYEAIDDYYRKNNRAESLAEKIKQAMDKFYQRIEALTTYQDLSSIDTPEIKNKLRLRDTLDYHTAQKKLQNAINQKQMHFDLLDKTQPRFNELLRLAKDQKILTGDEVKILIEGNIPTIPLFEDFLNEAMLLQFSSNYLQDMPQNALPAIFPFLYSSQNKIPAPSSEFGYDLVLTPLELAQRSHDLFPENRLIQLVIPGHTICREAIIIRNTLLHPLNKDWPQKQIRKFLNNNVPEKPDKLFKIAMLITKEALLYKRIETKQPITPSSSPKI